MRTYLAESETLSQSTDTLRRQLADVKNQLEVCTVLSISRHVLEHFSQRPSAS